MKNKKKKTTSAALDIYDHQFCMLCLSMLIGEPCWLLTKLMDEGKYLHFHQCCQSPKTYFPALLILIFSVALIKIAELQSNSLARNEVGINQLSVKYNIFIIVQNDCRAELGLDHVPVKTKIICEIPKLTVYFHKL